MPVSAHQWPILPGAECGGRRGVGAIGSIVVVGMLLLGRAGPAWAGDVSCEGFALGYDGDARNRKCSVEDTSSGNLVSEVKTLNISDPAFLLSVSFNHTGFRTYIPARSAEELLSGLNGFSSKAPVGEARNIRGFDTIAFNAVPADKSPPLLCALFVCYSGNPGNYEFPGGPGAKDATRGLYCAERGFLTAARQGEGYYDLVGEVIGKLRIPSSD